MKILRNKIISIIVLLVIFFLLFIYISNVFMPKWKDIDNTKPGIETFYNQPKNSIDVLFLGTSSFRNGISPLTLWQETGITSFLRATTGQHPIVSYYYLVESLEYQRPKVVFIDPISLFYNFDVDYHEPSLRKAVDPLRMSWVKLMLISDIVKYSENQSLISYIFPLIRYHERWKEGLTREDFEYYKIDYYDPFRGQYLHRGHLPQTIPNYFLGTNKDTLQYNADALLFFEKIIELSKAQNIHLIFLSLPRADNYSYSKHMAIDELARKHELKFIDFNDPLLMEEINLDPTVDFQNKTHLNVYGSFKVSKYLGAFLKENFSLLDKRGNPQLYEWDIDYDYLKFVIPSFFLSNELNLE